MRTRVLCALACLGLAWPVGLACRYIARGSVYFVCCLRASHQLKYIFIKRTRFVSSDFLIRLNEQNKEKIKILKKILRTAQQAANGHRRRTGIHGNAWRILEHTLANCNSKQQPHHLRNKRAMRMDSWWAKSMMLLRARTELRRPMLDLVCC